MTSEEGRSMVRFTASQRPILVVVVDTEEEFDWSSDFSRSAVAVTAMREIHRFQEICDEFGIRPTYVVTYPVASQADGAEQLKEFNTSGRAEIGTHLHPWVSPPFTEMLGTYNSYPGNLPPEVESEKLRVLTDIITGTFGVRPTSYKAGRYGIGPNTIEILSQQGYEIDLSAAPPLDNSVDGGTDFSTYPVEPYWAGDDSRLLCIPSTGAYVGFVRYGAHFIYSWANRGVLGRRKFPGILSRLGMIDRLRLSPEGYTLRENFKLTKALLNRGVRVFQFTLHSPSVMPKGTPYVASESERDRLLYLCRDYFQWFFHAAGGTTMTPTELRVHILGTQ